MRIENVHTTSYSRATRRTCEEGLIDQGAGRMKSHARHAGASGDLSKFRGGGNCSERQIGGVDFGCAVGLQGEHRAVRSSTEIGGRSISSGGDELIGSARIPKSE